MDPVSKAQGVQSNANSTRKYGGITGKGFKPGRSGNPGGRPKKLHITKMFEQVLANPENRNEIKQAIIKTLTDKGMAKVLMLREMAERTEGKVADVVDMNVTGSITLEQVLQAKKKAGK